MGQIKKKEETKMDSILSHGNKAGFGAIILLALSLCTAVGTYRLKKSSEIKLWEKTLAVYSEQLAKENQSAIRSESSK